MAIPALHPVQPLRLLPRRRLTELFRRASQARVVLCVAPAGHGKTVALTNFLKRPAELVAHVRLGERSGGLFTFVRELAAELSRLLNRPELTFSAVYDRVATSDTPEMDLARWLRSQLPERRVCVVIDNLERVASDPRAVRFLDLLIRETPQLTWYLLSRSAGSLPVPNWMADGLMGLPIDHQALAFQDVELAALARRYGSTFSAEELANLQAGTHGWALGVNARLRYGGAFADFEYDRRNAAGAYRALLDRCYRMCSDRDRDLLLDTALMPGLYPSALQVLGWKSVSRAIRELRARFPHFFNALPEVLAYDDLTRSYLIERLHDRGPEAFAAAVERCGNALEQAGRAGEALALYVEHGRADAVGALLERHGFPLVDSGFADLVSAALDALPADTGVARPVTLALRGSYEARLGRSDVSEAWFLHALKHSTGAVHDEITYRHACELLRRQRPDCIDLFESLERCASAPEMLANARSALAQAYFLEDRVEDARRAIREAVDVLSEIDDPEIVARTLGRAAYVSLYSEDLPAAADFGRRAIALAVPAHQYVIAIGAYSVLYSVACENGQVREALGHLTELAQLSTFTGNLDFQLYALAGAYELYAESFDLAGIARCESALASFDVHYDTSTTLEALLPARALQCTWRGAFDRAYALLAPSASQQRGAEWKAQRHAELALYAAACERRSDAQNEVRAAENALALGTAGTHMWIQTHIVLALAYSLQGQDAHAERCLNAVSSGLTRFPRLRDLWAAAQHLHRRWSGASNHSALLGALQALYSVQLGGFAKMFEQIPMPVAVRSQLARARAANERVSEPVLHMLERYPEVSLAV